MHPGPWSGIGRARSHSAWQRREVIGATLATFLFHFIFRRHDFSSRENIPDLLAQISMFSAKNFKIVSSGDPPVPRSRWATLYPLWLLCFQEPL